MRSDGEAELSLGFASLDGVVVVEELLGRVDVSLLVDGAAGGAIAPEVSVEPLTEPEVVVPAPLVWPVVEVSRPEVDPGAGVVPVVPAEEPVVPLVEPLVVPWVPETPDDLSELPEMSLEPDPVVAAVSLP